MFKNRTTEALQRITLEDKISQAFYRLVDQTTLSFEDIREKLVEQFENEEEFIDSLVDSEKYDY
jgi:hypothetical protein